MDGWIKYTWNIIVGKTNYFKVKLVGYLIIAIKNKNTYSRNAKLVDRLD